MNRFTSVFSTVSILAVAASSTAHAQGSEMELLKSRVSALESRVAVLENAAANGVHETSFATQEKKAESQLYVIKEGDTISEIARELGVPRSELMDANGIREGQQIFIGDQLKVPGKPVESSPKPQNIAEAPKAPAPDKPKKESVSATNYTNYTVRYGDTLSSISRQFGVSVASIKSTNSLKSDAIGGGQRLKIPAGSTGGATKANLADNKTEKPSAAGGGNSKNYENPLMKPEETYGEYTVAKGDNLYALARDFFTTMKELQRLNGLGSSTLIYPGDKIIVPTSRYNEYHNKVATR